jgi:hypothetical protein
MTADSQVGIMVDGADSQEALDFPERLFHFGEGPISSGDFFSGKAGSIGHEHADAVGAVRAFEGGVMLLIGEATSGVKE